MLQLSQLNTLDPYLGIFQNINWIISRGGNFSELSFIDTGEPIYNNRERFLSLQVPLTTGPIRLYFPFGKQHIGFEYPPGMSAIYVLGAINTFYDIPIPTEILPNLRRLYPQINSKIRNGQIPIFRDTMGGFVYFGGLYKFRDGYTIDIGSRIETPNINT